MLTSPYICGTTFGELWHFMLWASSLLPSTYFQLNLLCPSRATHGSHPWLIHISPHLSSLCIKRGGLTLRFLSFLKEAMECDGKTRQWRFSMENKVPLRDNRGATGGKLYLRHNSAQFNVSSFLDLYARI